MIIMKVRFVLLMTFIVLVAIICSGCSSVEPDGTSAKGEVDTEYADAIAENALQSLNERDYNKFSADFTPTMKKALTEELFFEYVDIIHDEVGNYTSKELVKVSVTDIHTVVVYNVAFEKEPEGAIFRIIFATENDELILRGMWIESPMIRKRLALEK